MANDDRANIGRRMASGAGWMVATRVADRIIGLLSLTVLARLLIPEDFGLLAIAWMLIGLVEMFGMFAPGLALIQKQDAERRHYDTAWTLRLLRGALIAGVLAVAARPAAEFFHEPRMTAIVYWLCAAVVVEGFTNIGTVNFRKDLLFHKEFTYLTSTRLIATSITVVLVIFWPTYWALVAGAVVRAFVRVLLSYALHDYRPRVSLAGFHDIFHFSKWVLAHNILASVIGRVPALALARLTNAEVLAFFSLAQEVSMIAARVFQVPVRRALFPGFAKLSSKPASLAKAFLNAFSLTFAISLPLAACVAVLADDIVRVILGDKWISAVPVLEILALTTIIHSFRIGNQALYLAVNRPRMTAVVAGIELIFVVPLTIWGVRSSGAIGAAWALVLTAMALVVVDYLAARTILKLDIAGLVTVNWRIIAATALMASAISFTRDLVPDAGGVLGAAVALAASICLAGAVYVIGLFTLWRLSGRPAGPEALIAEWVGRFWSGTSLPFVRRVTGLAKDSPSRYRG